MEFRAIATHPKDYKVNSKGEVFSVLRNKILKSFDRAHGYKGVELKGKAYAVHRLVVQAFIPNPLNKPMVNHINGIKSDNRVENLEWCTQSENCKHSFRIGTQSNKGEKHPNAKITLVQSKEIKILLSEGKLNQHEIAKKYNISNHLVCAINKGKLWNY